MLYDMFNAKREVSLKLKPRTVLAPSTGTL